MQKKRQALDIFGTATVILLCYLTALHAAPHPPLNFDGWVGEALAKLETDGITGGFHRHTAPYSRTEIVRIIQHAEKRSRAHTGSLSEIDRKLLEKLKREFHTELAHRFSDTGALHPLTHCESLCTSRRRVPMFGSENVELAVLPQLRATQEKIAPALEGAFHFQYRNLTIYTECEFQNFEDFHRQDVTTLAKGKTAEQRLEPWRGGYTGNVKSGYLQLATYNERLRLLVGRDAIFWGATPQYSVGISDNSPPFDMLRLTGTFGRFKATAFTTQLDATWYDDGNTRYLAKRYLSAHRLEYQHFDRLNIGLSEWVLYGGDAQTLDFKYANPVTFYYALQYNAKADDNVMFALDVAVRPVDGLRLYAEWLIDDLQYVPGANDPHAVAWLCGVTWYPDKLRRQLGIHTEYARVNRWAYTHLVPENQFTHFGHIIGHPIGTDADTFNLSLSYQWTPDTKTALTANLTRNGEATVADRFYGEDFKALPFPTGVVEYITRIGGTISYRPLASWNASLRYAWQTIRNRGHHLDKTHTEYHLALYISFLYKKMRFTHEYPRHKR